MSIARHHAEWLSLLEISGPFLSMPVLMDAFPQELDAHDAERAGELRAAYGWDDLDLVHGFHETAQGVRFTISEPARREVLTWLLELNHDRYAEEVRQGLHEKKGKKSSRQGAR